LGRLESYCIALPIFIEVFVSCVPLFFTNYRKKTLTISTLENFGTPVWVSRFVFSDVSDKKRDKTGILSIKTGTRSQRTDGLMH
jgi:hypothetical protein